MARPRAHPRPTIRLTTPTDLIASIPYLLGFHPTDSLVAVGVRGKEVVFTGRCALPPPDDEPRSGVAGLLAAFLGSHCCEALLVGFGAAADVTPSVDAGRELFTAHAIHVREALRVTDGRYWSYICGDARCCPPEGTSFNRDSSDVAATFTAAGFAAHRDRSALASSVAPVVGSPRRAMRLATQTVEDQLDRRWPHLRSAQSDQRAPSDSDRPVGDLARAEPAFTTEGLSLVREIMARATAGAEPPSIDEMALLSVVLRSARVRDDAWVGIGPERLEEQLALWIRLMRHAEPPYRAAPACLAAFTAWRTGRGGLANLALEQVAEVEPDYSMALVLRGLLDLGIPPDRWCELKAEWLPDPDLPGFE